MSLLYLRIPPVRFRTVYCSCNLHKLTINKIGPAVFQFLQLRNPNQPYHASHEAPQKNNRGDQGKQQNLQKEQYYPSHKTKGFSGIPPGMCTEKLTDEIYHHSTEAYSYKKGTHLTNKSTKKVINYRRTSHFKMEFEAPLPICIDGEIKGAKSVDFSVVPGGFNFVVPKDCELKYKK